MYNRLLEFLNRGQILSDNQYGFRKKHSTSYALTKLFDKLSCAIDNREIAVGVFIDLSKAFDTVDHEILLEKLEHYGIRGVAHNWFRSYLSNRQQYVEFNSTFSPCQQIRCGVPQGSILGPLLFLVYINDLCNVSTALEFILFADDTNIFFSHKDRSTLSTIFNLEMSKLSDWCRANKLSINLKKSNFMVFQPRQKRQKFDLAFSIDGSPIERVKETVFLGVVIDENLTWKPHILNVSRKISKSIGILYKSSFCLSTAALRILYYSLIYPYLIYCVSVWGSTYNSNIKKIVTLQKKAIRIVAKVSFDSHTDPIFRELEVLKFNDIVLFHLGKFMFFFCKGLLPNAFNDMFTPTNQIHSYDTRNSSKFYIPFFRTNIRKFSIRYQGPKFYNSLDSEIKSSESTARFCKNLKRFLLSR